MKIFYYTIQTYGDGDKGVRIYIIKNNKPARLDLIDVTWGSNPETAIIDYINRNNLAKEFRCEEL